MKTDHIDLYFIHGVNDIKEITGETKAWMEKAKADKKIKFFGFSAHKNMQTLLVEAAKLGWIDGIMMTYNYRLMQEDKMKAAIEACVKAGIGLTAMKSQGGGPVKTDSEAELKLAGHFIQKGFTQHQAKLKAVWQNPDIASICSQMPSMAILTQNVAAALDNSKLTAADWDALRTYEKETASSYCAGCRHHCESALGRECHVSDLMRCMMYHVSYGDTQLARQTFAQLPSEMRLQLGNMDFAAAERACPRGLSIGQIAREALKTLA
ncbi:MAG: aldo/keto reductase [Candidatus Sumerlaeota bacterium]|nr:aldo/keto reductase [Candidatus Sumerlaeota bacterium]